jgi:hypothetical protein
VVFVFIFLAALYESLTLPLAVILIVPMCLLAAMPRRQLARPRQQHPHADRHGRADRPRGEERDPDRRVRAPGRGAGMSAVDAAIAAAKTRLRPILMTSAAFIFGVIPLAFGSRARRGATPVARRGGVLRMIGVTLFGLVFTPLFYVLCRKLAGRIYGARVPRVRIVQVGATEAAPSPTRA